MNKKVSTQVFYEDMQDAIRSTVSALGGMKKIGHLLKPHLSSDAAGRWLNDTLNDSRNEVQCYSQLVLILQMGRKAGVHGLAIQLCREAGYADPVPVDPEDEKAKLQKEFLRAIEDQRTLVKRMEALAGASLQAISNG